MIIQSVDPKHIILSCIMFTSLLFVCGLSHIHADTEPTKMDFWSTQKKGANIFNQIIPHDTIQAAKQQGIQFIRLCSDKFITTHRDFLIGNADDYCGLIKEDLAYLKSILNMCAEEKIAVVITMLSLPGTRWKQNNNDQIDGRLWQEEKFQKQAALFWKDLASELKDHPAIVGYNILNEPRPQRTLTDKTEEEIETVLHDVYTRIIASIRSVDTDTPIILDSSECADSQAFRFFKPHADPNVIYSFHMYEPYEYTNFKSNQGRFEYPGITEGHYWNKDALKKYMSPVMDFQRIYNIPFHKILVGEFGGNRRSTGLEHYFDDLTDIFNEQGWHFAFYAFREDTWDGMNYELGNKAMPLHYSPITELNNTHAAFLTLKRKLEQ